MENRGREHKNRGTRMGNRLASRRDEAGKPNRGARAERERGGGGGGCGDVASRLSEGRKVEGIKQTIGVFVVVVVVCHSQARPGIARE